MNFAQVAFEARGDGGVTPAGLIAAFKQARAAGDTELADAIKSHVASLTRLPQLAAGDMTLVLRSGRRVPLRSAVQHIIRRGAGRPTEKPAAPGSFLDTLQKLSARCRKLRSEIDRRKIADAIAEGMGCARSKPTTRAMCPYCRLELDPDGECYGCDYDGDDCDVVDDDDPRLAKW